MATRSDALRYNNQITGTARMNLVVGAVNTGPRKQRQQFRANRGNSRQFHQRHRLSDPFTSCPSSVVVFATLAVLRPSVTPTANPIVAAVPRVVVMATHYRRCGNAYLRYEAR
jgi:hypothetical protein